MGKIVFVNNESILNNLEILKKMAMPSELIVVLKGNAYGHGLIKVASLASKCNVRFFAVDSVDSAIMLRSKGFRQNILVLGSANVSGLRHAIDHKIDITITDWYHYQEIKNWLSVENKNIGVHLKIDTGLNRYGFSSSDKYIVKMLQSIAVDRHFSIKGIYSHLVSDDTPTHFTSSKQVNSLEDIISKLKMEGIDTGLSHALSSSGVLNDVVNPFDLVRTGIAVFGGKPSYSNQKNISALEPALEVSTLVTTIRTIEEGEFVGYGQSWKAERDSKIAILPIGFYDGVPRNLSHKGKVLVQGEFANVIGEVGMNHMSVDVTDISGVERGSQVILLGLQGQRRITAEDVASWTNSINTEILINLGLGPTGTI